MTRNKGFSLIELMVAVAIIGILSAVAIPAYSDYVMRGKMTEAFTGLADGRVRMEQYFQDNRSYRTNPVNNNDCGIVAALPQSKYFTFACSATSASLYTITATGKGAQGMGGIEYSIDQSNGKASNISKSGWNNPNPNTCWATKKDGSC